MTSIAGSVRLPRFWTVVAVTFMCGALYPAVLLVECDAVAAARWIQNDVAFSVFVLWLFPLMSALLWVSILPGLRAHLLPRSRQIGAALLILLVICSLLVVVSDAARIDEDGRPMVIEPALSRNRGAMKADLDLRKPLRASYAALLDQTFVTPEAEKKAWIDWDLTRVRSVAAFRAQFPGFTGVSDVLRNGSATAIVKLTLNAIVAVTLALLFGSFVGAVVILYRAPTTPLNSEAVLVAYSLACLWFPMRLYSEWYDGYYSLGRLRSYPAFWVLVLVALLGLALLVYILKPGRVGITIPSMAAAFGIVFSAVGALKPKVLWYLGTVIETFNLALLFVVAIVLVTPFAAVAFAASSPVTVSPEPTAPID